MHCARVHKFSTVPIIIEPSQYKNTIKIKMSTILLQNDLTSETEKKLREIKEQR
jgi:hypothetical protein